MWRRGDSTAAAVQATACEGASRSNPLQVLASITDRHGGNRTPGRVWRQLAGCLEAGCIALWERGCRDACEMRRSGGMPETHQPDENWS